MAKVKQTKKSAAAEVLDALIGVAEVQRLTGIRSAVTFWRGYTAKPATFPAPAGFILGRRMWRLAEVNAWVAAQLARPPRKSKNLTDARPAGGAR